MEKMSNQEMQTELQYRLIQSILGMPTASKFMQETKLFEVICNLPGFKEACEKFTKKCPSLTEFDYEAFSDVAYQYANELLLGLLKAKIIKVGFLDERF